MRAPQNPSLALAVGWVMTFCVFDAVALSLARALVGRASALQIVAVGNAVCALALVPALVRGGPWRSRNLTLHAVRAALAVVTEALIFVSVAYVPLAAVKSLSCAVPIFTSVGAVLFLGEPSRRHTWWGLACGMTGICCILRPGFDLVHPASLLVVLAALTAAVSSLVLKRLAAREPAHQIVFFKSLLTFLAVLPFVASERSAAPWPAAGLLLAYGLTYLAMQLFLARAFSLAPVVLIAPWMFLSLVFVVALAFVLWFEVPSVTTVTGALAIVAAALLSSREPAVSRTDTGSGG